MFPWSVPPEVQQFALEKLPGPEVYSCCLGQKDSLLACAAGNKAFLDHVGSCWYMLTLNRYFLLRAGGWILKWSLRFLCNTCLWLSSCFYFHQSWLKCTFASKHQPQAECIVLYLGAGWSLVEIRKRISWLVQDSGIYQMKWRMGAGNESESL